RAGDGNRQRASAECQIPEFRDPTTAIGISLSSQHCLLLSRSYVMLAGATKWRNRHAPAPFASKNGHSIEWGKAGVMNAGFPQRETTRVKAG
ncbi:MAG TPA: hypothetical protein P5081_23740, partial [Phycisphaerae bacterium]|nr:hypothetical protein [Phycisphaerae bacterium]HRW55897.1 hypothetical protein [Phycisphaerae bacterium]